MNHVQALDDRARHQFNLSPIRPHSMINIGLHIKLPVVSMSKEERIKEGMFHGKLGFHAIVGIVGTTTQETSSAKMVSCLAILIGRYNDSLEDPSDAEMKEDTLHMRTSDSVVLLRYEILARSKERWFYLGDDTVDDRRIPPLVATPPITNPQDLQ